MLVGSLLKDAMHRGGFDPSRFWQRDFEKTITATSLCDKQKPQPTLNLLTTEERNV